MTQKIVPHLWFDTEAKEAGTFYTSIFPHSRIRDVTTLHNTPSGSVDIVSITIAGYDLMLISAGPLFTFNPSISFLIACNSRDEVTRLWQQLGKGGMPLMELGAYPFSERYGWTQDRFGLSWQIMYVPDGQSEHRIIPTLMFVGEQAGKAEEAMQYYVSVFSTAPVQTGASRVEQVLYYESGEEPDKAGTVKHGAFTLLGQEFAAMDSARVHSFAFNEAISFIVNCDSQMEIDYYWAKLSAVPEAEQCGWLKDSYGLPWQIVPTAMEQMFKEKDEHKIANVTEAFLKMKKFDIRELQAAYDRD